MPAVPWWWARRSRRSGHGRGCRGAAAGGAIANIAPAIAVLVAHARERLVARREHGERACTHAATAGTGKGGLPP